MDWKKVTKMFTVAACVGVGGASLIIAADATKKGSGCSDKGCSISHKPKKAAPSACSTKGCTDTHAAAKDPWSFLPNVVATIGKEKVSKEDFLKEIKPMMPPTMANIPAERLKLAAPNMVKSVVEKILLLKMAKKAGIVPSSELVLKEFNKSFKDMSAQEKQQFEMMLKMQNMSVEDYKKKLSSDPMAQEGMAISQWVSDYVKKKVTVSDEAIKKHYDANLESFKKPAMVSASHILIKADSDSKEADQAAKKKAEDLLAKIAKGAESFEKLAEAESACPSGKRNKGSLGEFPRGQMVKEFEDAAFALEPNQLSKVVKTQFGYHIIKVTDKKAAHTIQLKKAKEQIKEKLTTDEIKNVLKNLIEEEKKRLNVKINV